MKENKKMNGYLYGACILFALAAVIVGVVVGMTVKARAGTAESGRADVARLVYVGYDPMGRAVERELTDGDAIWRVVSRFDVCPMADAHVGDETVIRTVLDADFAVKIYFRGCEEPAVMYYTFTDRVAVISPDGYCAVSEGAMMDTEAVRNEFWREEGGWNARTVD